MADVRFYTGIDMRTFAGYDFADIASGSSRSASSTTAEVKWGSQNYLARLGGTDFAGYSNNLPTTGTVNNWNFGYETYTTIFGTTYTFYTPLWSFGGFAVPAADFSSALLNNTVSSVMPAVLAGDDTISGSGADDYLLAYAGADSLSGYGGNDTLDGGSGADVMAGGVGDDIFIVDNDGDEVNEASGEGNDHVFSAVTFDLDSNVERLTLTGTQAIDGIGNGLANRLVGNAAANILYGMNGDDTLDGGAGADTMKGGGGNDTYYRDNASDLVHEFADAGLDRVLSSVTYGLYGHIEYLYLTGTAAINGYGNSLDNWIFGNSAANVLNGGPGADAMWGGGGNDRYYIDNPSDGANEYLDEGTDYVFSTISYTLLGENLEHLNLVGTAAIDGTGNALNNTINGNSANNVLDGLVGTDTLRGGLGDDTYYRDNAGDALVEAADQGIDLVYSLVSYGLGANLENLILDGAADINGHGNALANSITGNEGLNTLNGNDGSDELSGMGGNDTINGDNGADSLNGGTGNDTMNGGAGVDLFLFDTALDAATNVDTIISYSVADDTIQLDNDIFAAAGDLGTLSASTFRAGASAADADDRIIYDSPTGRIYYDADGNGAGAQVLFAQVSAGLALTNADFQIVG